MHQKIAAGDDMLRPGLVIGPGRFEAVPPVDKHKAQGGRPLASRYRRRAYDGNDGILQAAARNGLPEKTERVDPAGGRVDQVGVAVFLTGLLLLRSPVVVDGEEHAAGGLETGPQIKGRLAAVAPNLKPRPEASWQVIRNRRRSGSAAMMGARLVSDRQGATTLAVLEPMVAVQSRP